ncbi:MAG TPA: DUF456 domain-containing protein [Spirochaetota bacterium]|nr:DUF456 domain-containing protein [Spirochaetota bacterium]
MPYIHEIVLVIAIIFAILGVAGCVIPAIPGPFVSFGALLMLNWTKFADVSIWAIIVFGFFAVLVTVLDYVLPPMGSLKFGGTKRGSVGATIGLFVGIFFFPPLGIFIGAFVGAFIAEKTGGMETDPSLKAAFGAFLGVITGVVVKFLLSISIFVFMTVYTVSYFVS